MESEKKGNTANLHALMFPYPTQGHITPMMELAQVLASWGFTITFLNTSISHSRVHRSLTESPLDPSLDIRFEVLSQPLGLSGDSHQTQERAYRFDRFLELEGMAGVLTELVDKLLAAEPPLICIISDILLSWTNRVADKFKLIKVNLYPSASTTCVLWRSLRLLFSEGILPLKADHPNKTIDCIPGFPLILDTHDLPDFWRQFQDLSDSMAQFSLRRIDDVAAADWILVNSFDELESYSMHMGAPILQIGPLVPFGFTNDDGKVLQRKTRINPWPEDEKCMRWLDSQPPSSVVYVSFGSTGGFTMNQVEELAMGLLACQQPFLWVFPPDIVSGSGSSCFPPDILSSGKLRGLVVPWAPQFQVLSHPSVAVFITHCGWNSVMESIFNGVPMLLWPYFAEQNTNAKLLETKWKVGMELGRDQGELVSRETIQRKVKDIIGVDGDCEIRKAAENLREAARRAVLAEDGSSQRNLRTFVKEMAELWRTKMATREESGD